MTLAKVIYNQILHQFDGRNFLNDIRESVKQNGLKYLQSLLVADILRRERQDFTSVDEGTEELKRRFRDKRVFIVLDDVDHASQLTALAAKLDWLGPGSRIIITTRNRVVLQVPQVKWTYEVVEMNEDHAPQLFCKHAFRQGSPMAKLSALAKGIVETTGGLPLALEVIGSFLSGKSETIWESTLEKLRAIPYAEVQDKLRISYEALDHQRKQIFLDIACLFTGEDKNIPSYMWKDCNFFPEGGIDILLLMSLIKIVPDNKLWMHDQLKDLGQEIVRKENYGQPGKRSRLWYYEEARDELDNSEGTENVLAIHLDFRVGSEDSCFTEEQFRKLSKLSFLRLHCTALEGDFDGCLSNLRWLSLH
ncbi:hypothetical protein CDL15_Pgr008229 [Punica granatum]|uniref:Uncharacterized protein n=1 Tax=Punica granatum TaxID=22663 RepID=A0A218VTI4_PUNGR|nr:hypothetical protein CDL15_Pgr008229 [Punica granatum]